MRRSLQAACLAASLAAAFAVGAWAQARMPKDTAWALRMPKEEKIAWRGALSAQGSGGPGAQMMYPAPNAAGLLAAILTHAAIAGSVQSEQQRKAQEAADQVLKPYQPSLEGFQHKELMEKGLAKVSVAGSRALVGPAEKPAAGWVVESAPQFMMTQDQRALILDNAVAIYGPGDPSKPAYQNVIRVVSQPQLHPDLMSFWNAEQGRALRDESASLFAHSLELALLDATGGVAENAAQRTFRYPEGSAERMERAQLIREHCDRVLVKNLRGWLMSIPARQPGPECGGPRPALQAAAAVAPAAPAATQVAIAAPAATSAVPLQSGDRFPKESDTWTYRLTEPRRASGPTQRKYEVKIAAASATEIVERYSVEEGPSGEWKHRAGAYLVGAGASVFSPYLAAFQDLSDQPALGRVELADPVCGGRTQCEATAKVIGRETVRVPAGSFETVHVKVVQSWSERTGAGVLAGERELYIWYAPALKRAVKFSSRRTSGAPAPFDTEFELELVSYQLK